MNSARGAYKAKLREVSSITNRRRSKGVERKNNRNDEINKRRNLSNDMSPVVEKRDNESTLQGRAQQKGPSKGKVDVLERLNQWREIKKREREQEKISAKSKPTFKAGAMVRGSEAVLFKGDASKSKAGVRSKDVEKAPLPKKQPAKPKEPAPPKKQPAKTKEPAPKTRARTADSAPKLNTAASVKAPATKKQSAKTKESAPPTTRAPRLPRTGDLASKLTAAAAAKRNAIASPKKFLRATRATTLQKKDPVNNKKGAKSLKGSLKSTGNLLAKTVDLGEKSLKASSKSTGNLLTKEMDLGSAEDSTEEEITSMNTEELTSMDVEENLDEISTANNIISVIPNEVPKILADFNFSAMASSNDSAGGSQTESSDHFEAFSFAGLNLKPKRKSTRTSTRLTSHNMESSGDDLIAFTPASKRKSVRKSKGFHSLVQPAIENMVTEDVEGEISIQVSDTPKSAKRKSMRRSIRADLELVEADLLPEEVQGEDDVSIPKSGRKKSMRRSILSASTEVAENVADSKVRSTPKSAMKKSMRKSTRLTALSTESMDNDFGGSPKMEVAVVATPKSDRRKSNRKSKVLGSTASKKFDNLHISDPDDSPNSSLTAASGGAKNVMESTPGNSSKVRSSKLIRVRGDSGIPSTPTSSSRRKNVRKSLSLHAALALVQSDSDNILNSGSKVSQENAIKMDTAEQIESDIDTQAPLVEATSTPKIMKSAQKKRQSLTAAMVLSSIDSMSPGELPAPSPRPSQRGSHIKRKSSLGRRSRKSMGTPVTSRRSTSGNVDLDISNVSTPNSVIKKENIPRRRSTVISVSDEGTAVGRELEPALAYKVETVRRSARASRILNELVIEKVDGEKSFFEVSFESMKGSSRNNSMNIQKSKCNTPLGLNRTPQSNTTSPFTPRKSNEVTVSSGNNSSNPITTPTSALRARHSMAISSSGFKEPGLPLSALRQPGSHQRRRTCHTPKSKTPEHMIGILKKSPMVEMSRRRSRHVSSPGAAPKGQYFRDLISNETERLANLSQKWNAVASREVGLQEEVLGQIRSTVGKALLLIEQRFKQFSGLVDNYAFDLGEKKTTPTDLQGFWDMIYFQVEDVNNQFKELDELQQSGWQVKRNTPKAACLQLKKKITKGKPKAKGVKSNFASFRAELQKKKAAQATSTLPSDEMFLI